MFSERMFNILEKFVYHSSFQNEAVIRNERE